MAFSACLSRAIAVPRPGESIWACCGGTFSEISHAITFAGKLASRVCRYIVPAPSHWLRRSDAMNLLRHFWDTLLRRPKDRVRRVIVLVLQGFDWRRAEQYLGDGLLHYLPLLSDIGAHFDVGSEAAFDVDTCVLCLRTAGTRVELLTSVPTAARANLDELCAADRTQQEQLFTFLRRRRSGVVVATCDLLSRIERLHGSQPTADQQLVIRDVHARMDEHVGKAFSFVDRETALVVVTPARCVESSPISGEPNTCRVFVSRPLPTDELPPTSLADLVQKLLGSAA